MFRCLYPDWNNFTKTVTSLPGSMRKHTLLFLTYSPFSQFKRKNNVFSEGTIARHLWSETIWQMRHTRAAGNARKLTVSVLEK